MYCYRILQYLQDISRMFFTCGINPNDVNFKKIYERTKFSEIFQHAIKFENYKLQIKI